jgi:nitrous oxidase accessory protein
MMTKGSRIALLVASLALGLVYVLPLWRITLQAPQYPEGLGMVIRINTIEGVKQHDLTNINNLNHYIGMKRIVPEAIPELKIMPYAVGALMLLGLLAAALGRRKGLYAWTGIFLLSAVVGMVDFWKWEYDYGHNLDQENAIIKVPGMSYQPPLIGSRQILNFTAHSWPGSGGWILILAGAGAAFLSFSEFRRRHGPKPAVTTESHPPQDGDSRGPGSTGPAGPTMLALALAGAAVTAGCGSPEPRALVYGSDACDHCLMGLAGPGHGTELLTPTGRAYTFDSIECMVGFLDAMEDPEEVHSLWVTDFAEPEVLIPAEKAFFLASPTLTSPMGLGLTGFARVEDRDGAVNAFGGEALDWNGVRELVAARWDGNGQAHGGHAETLIAQHAPPPALQRGSDPIRVTPRGPWTRIADAVAQASPHDTIVVEPGVYSEPTIVLDRPLTLLGLPGAILDGEGERGLITVLADSVTVQGLTFRNTGITFTDDRAAVTVDQARFCRIVGNRIEDAFFGIYLANAGDCLVAENLLFASGERETRSGNGIHLWYSARVSIRDNRIEGHRDGIYFEFVEDSRVEGNVSRENLRYGLHFMFSDRCDYLNNTFVRNGAGVAVMYTESVVMEGNDFDENRGGASFGLLLKEITDSRIEGNRFRRNSVGLHAEGASRVEVRGNDFVSNGWAIQVLANSGESVFAGNNFVANSFDVSTNSRRAYSTFEGNYWDRYRGYDRDRDGVGDVPFRPVRLFSLIVEQNEPALVLQRSFLVDLLDLAEQVLPVLTPENLQDQTPSLGPLPTAWSRS